MNTKAIVLASSLFSVAAAQAAETSGSIEFGYLARSGNTDSTDVNAKFDIARSYTNWKNSAKANLELSEESDTRTAERYSVGLKSEYRLSDQDYLFGTIDYENDEFGAYESRLTEALGYGRRLINQEQQMLDLELGLGARQATLQTGEDQDDAIARLGLNYLYTFATSADFSNKLLIESGGENTYVQNESAVRMPLLENVSLKVAYTLRHNTEVATGTEKTDTLTAVNVAYTF